MPTRRGLVAGLFGLAVVPVTKLLGLGVRPQEYFVLNYQGGFYWSKVEPWALGGNVVVKFPKLFKRYPLVLLQQNHWAIRLWCSKATLTEVWIGWEATDGHPHPAVEFTWFAFTPSDGTTLPYEEQR